MTSTSRTLAAAKLNVYLDVVRRRPDGFHDLETLFVRLPWGDDVELLVDAHPGVRLRLESDDARVPADASNLAVRAAEAYLAEAAREGPASGVGLTIRLAKRIPSGAGLGGGSSDAGAVLRLLDRELGAVAPDRLQALAADLGSDVPFFLLDAAAAIGRGRGELLEPVGPVGLEALALILPGTHHETRTVFGHVTPGEVPAPTGGLAAACRAVESGVSSAIRAAAWNALEPAVLRAYPRYAGLVAAIEERLGRRPHLTGTGSALYDLPDAGELEQVSAQLVGLPVDVVPLRMRA